MADEDGGGKKKKSRKERMAEAREFDRSLGLSRGTGADLEKVSDRHMDDQRYTKCAHAHRDEQWG